MIQNQKYNELIPDSSLAGFLMNFMGYGESPDIEKYVKSDGNQSLNPNITGAANLEHFNNAFEKIIKNAKSGDHVLLSLNDHGNKDLNKPQNWMVNLGTSNNAPENISTNDLKPLIEKLNQNGVVTHINVQSCFSGGFNQLTQLNNSKASTCTVTSTGSEIPGYGGSGTFENYFNDKFALYGNQLEAFACSVGADQWNTPLTSLDQVVKEWENNQPANIQISCENNNIETNTLNDTISMIQKPSNEALRNELLKTYQSTFSKRLSECDTSSKDEPIRVNLLQCLKSSNMMAPQKKDLTDTLSQIGSGYRNQLLEHHLNFLKKADPETLLKFRTAFCCLSYNFKDGSTPSV